MALSPGAFATYPGCHRLLSQIGARAMSTLWQMVPAFAPFRQAQASKQPVVAAGVAVDTSKAVTRIAAFEKALDDIFFHRAL